MIWLSTGELQWGKNGGKLTEKRYFWPFCKHEYCLMWSKEANTKPSTFGTYGALKEKRNLEYVNIFLHKAYIN